MLPGNARAEPNIATAGGILPSISKPSTNSAMMRKMRQVSLLVKSSMTYCSSNPLRFMVRNLRKTSLTLKIHSSIYDKMSAEISFCPLCAVKLNAGDDKQFVCEDCETHL